MIGIDTNILLRYVLDDDHQQNRLAARLIDRECTADDSAFVSDVVLAEAVWYVAKKLRRPKSEVIKVIYDIIENEHLVFASEAAILTAVNAYAEGRGGFVDYLITATNRERGLEHTYTYDTDAAKEGALTLLAAKD